MRDYSFGNFISALRMRRGLSQYQLGVLVGVSDKAVSKWENGVSKPRINIMRKLSEVFEVSVDELLTCEYEIFNREGKDLFTMKMEIIRKAREKMINLYGDNPPIWISNRFMTEKLMLDGQEMLLWMGFLGKLQEQFSKSDFYFEIRSAQMGASFIAWLLGGTNVNPLPAHYYCPICKKVEYVPNTKYGIDLPDKRCSCGNILHKDGFGIDVINMYPFFRWTELYVSRNGTERVKKCLQEYFNGYGEIRELRISYDEAVEVYSSEHIVSTKFVLLSQAMDKKFPEGIITLQPEEYSKMLDEISVLTVVENVEEKVCWQDLSNIQFTSQQIKTFFNYAIEKGKFDGYACDMNMSKVFSNLNTPKFSDLVALYGFVHSTGAWKGNAELLYEKGIALDELIFSREDVYDYLYNKLNGRCCDNPSGQVFEIKEAVRKGKYSNNRMPMEIEQLLLECEIPKWYIESMKKILYLFPKTHLIALLKKEIYMFSREKGCLKQ